MTRTTTQRLLALGLMAGALALPMAAQAGEGGGGHMSSYVSDPSHDPRSLHSQRVGSGQLLGAPMVHDSGHATVARRSVIDPHWASGHVERRTRR